MRALGSLAALLATFAVLSGCALAATAVYDAETKRIGVLRAWEADILARDCAGLVEAQVELEAQRNDLVDADQRQSILDDARAEKECPQA